jgi:hypothetical protein
MPEQASSLEQLSHSSVTWTGNSSMPQKQLPLLLLSHVSADNNASN